MCTFSNTWRKINSVLIRLSNALIELKDQDYDGIFCANNTIAKAILKELARTKSELDVKIISFDDIEIFDIVNPKVSSIAQPIKEIGSNAVNMLIDRLDNSETHKPQHLILDTVLIER